MMIYKKNTLADRWIDLIVDTLHTSKKVVRYGKKWGGVGTSAGWSRGLQFCKKVCDPDFMKYILILWSQNF